ncbi:MAG: ribonuclease HI family protein [Candidatus Woesebacteria bacterium]|nr:MAG: ribonuclease HI family protein [Candidatus Woesebacteria bacterium]
MTNIKIFTDGGARGNPGPAASAFVVFDSTDKEIYKSSKFIGLTTNNVAEYKALLMALDWLKFFQNLKDLNLINFYLDSELVVKQLTGIYKIKSPDLIPLTLNIKEQEKLINKKIIYQHIPRGQNKLADKLVNLALDKELSSHK